MQVPADASTAAKGADNAAQHRARPAEDQGTTAAGTDEKVVSQRANDKAAAAAAACTRAGSPVQPRTRNSAYPGKPAAELRQHKSPSQPEQRAGKAQKRRPSSLAGGASSGFPTSDKQAAALRHHPLEFCRDMRKCRNVCGVVLLATHGTRSAVLSCRSQMHPKSRCLYSMCRSTMTNQCVDLAMQGACCQGQLADGKCRHQQPWWRTAGATSGAFRA